MPSAPFPGLPHLVWLTLHSVGASRPAGLWLEVPILHRLSQSYSASLQGLRAGALWRRHQHSHYTPQPGEQDEVVVVVAKCGLE